jgi:predicted MPP superfamily phosphohydrolase
VVQEYEVQLAGLPAQRDGLVMIAISDLHLGALVGRGWLERVVHRVNALRPDLVVLVGDILEGDDDRVRDEIVPTLAKLRAPLGVWGVTGNHEFYSGRQPSVALMELAGCAVLRDSWVEVAPGLVLAGVDDLTGRGQFDTKDAPVQKALANRPAGAAILLSHSPWLAETAAAAGAGLMLSGHTHNGQIWPFNYLVRLRYPLLGGRYEVSGMPVIVCRGTGTWGPRMRLWRPGEILRITFHAARQSA